MWRARHQVAFNSTHFGSAREGPAKSAPLDRQCQALFAGVQPRTPAGQPASFIHRNGGRTVALGDQPDQSGPGALLPASNTRSNRARAPFQQFSHYVSNLPSCFWRLATRELPLQSGARQGARIPEVSPVLSSLAPGRGLPKPGAPPARRLTGGRSRRVGRYSAFTGAASETMSIRHPVSFAASRAFWPSLPMASESW